MPILLIILFLWYIYSPSGIGQVRTSDLDVLAKESSLYFGKRYQLGYQKMRVVMPFPLTWLPYFPIKGRMKLS
jgi:hypothetical protein